MAKLCVEWVDGAKQTQRLAIEDKIFIGRVCAGVDPSKRIVVTHSLVSRDHVVISVAPQGLEVLDSSKNGTWINTVRMTPGSPRIIGVDDVVLLGETEFRVCLVEAEVQEEKPQYRSDETVVMPVVSMVTHAVADVRGFSSMSQKEASTSVYELMREVFDTFSEIVQQGQGTVKDFSGDAVYAFWEHRRVADKKRAIAACEAVIKQAQSVKMIKDKLRGSNSLAADLRLGWGVTTGTVTLSHYGSRVADLAVVGDSTNLAFRFSGLANKELPAAVVMCSATAAMVKDKFPLVDLGSVPVKGRTGQERVYGIEVEMGQDLGG